MSLLDDSLISIENISMSGEAKSWPNFVGKDAKEVESQLKAEGIPNLLSKIVHIDLII